MFALESLGIAGESCANSDRVRRACDFLLSKQMADGGWGETYMVSQAPEAKRRVFSFFLSDTTYRAV
jgi:squalene cyclase